MITSPQMLEQEVLQNNKEIFVRIVKELENADFEILIATAWFTDEELFDIVKRKAEQRVNVRLIIADNQENQKLNFEELIALGASVTRIKGVGYGNMNQKFCVVDKRIALHGSYNWSVNARKNNHESVIVTNHQQTVNSLIETFNDINKRVQQTSETIEETLEVSEITEHNKESVTITSNIEKHTAKEHAVSEFTKVLESMIAAEIANFDRKLLREQGYERSKYNNGDHQVLTKAMDTVYSVFINDIDVVDDKKRRLLSKIDEQEIISVKAFDENLNLQLQSAESEYEIETLNTKNKLINLKSEAEKNKQHIENLKQNKITVHEKVIGEIKEKIRREQQDLVKPKFRWYEFIPVAIANLLLIVYSFVFYSSAGYILLFAVDDFREAMATNQAAVPMEIFNPEAMTKTGDKGWPGILFICLFVSVPLFCALVKLFTKKKWVVAVMFLTGILLVDTAIAYKVASSIYEMKMLTGEKTDAWNAAMAFGETNFYLVFLLGTLGLLMLKFAFEKLISIFDERNPDILTLKKDLLVKQMNEDMKLEEGKILLIKEEVYAAENLNVDLEAQYKITEAHMASLPGKLNLLKEIKRSDLITGKQHIKDIATIYKSHIENDYLPISIDSLRDRINIFLEGWTDYLHEHYSISKAVEKSREAFETAINWQNEKMSSPQIDKRVKI